MKSTRREEKGIFHIAFLNEHQSVYIKKGS